MADAATECPVKICKAGGKGIILPLANDWEWPNSVCVILYFVGLGWCFMGVAIVADVFMCAIEKITSKKKRKYCIHSGKFVTVKVWNDTIANLTLMALGSSAPEILLSVIELLGNDFYAGDLGPSTIVGSAAFNLFVIIAVCVTAIPKGEVRFINETTVFGVTAFWSVFAYVWLLVIVVWITEDVVDVLEGVTSFLFFPLLIVSAFAADKGWLPRSAAALQSHAEPKLVTFDVEDISKEDLASMELKILQEYGHNISDEELSSLIERQYGPAPSRAAYRLGVMRAINGGLARQDRVSQMMANRASRIGRTSICSSSTVRPARKSGVVVPIESLDELRTEFEFVDPIYAVLENVGTTAINVQRRGQVGFVASVNYETCDGTAKAGEDYVAVKGTLLFGVGEVEKTIYIDIIDDNEFEEKEEFYVHLLRASSSEKRCVAEVGSNATATIKIIDDDLPGIFAFLQETITVVEGIDETSVRIVVQRLGGVRGHVTCKYSTEDATAVANKDFVPVEGTLDFPDGRASADIDIIIKPRGRYETSECFRVVISHATGGSTFKLETDGGVDCCICTVIINSDAEIHDRVDRVISVFRLNWEWTDSGKISYLQQFLDAVKISDDEDCNPGVTDYIMYVIILPWKLLFATIPPTGFCDGWACFFVALIFIGGVTAIIGDMASLLGCSMGIPDSITAITFVALGTSLPDTFASRSAALQDKYADASVGNVMGSNSVNVFLGLGLPWMIGAIYWATAGQTDEWKLKYPDIAARLDGDGGKFVVMGGNLGFSVSVFTACAVVCLCCLVVRRRALGGELGGPNNMLTYATGVMLVALWLVYVGLSSWKAMGSKGRCD